MRDIALNIHTDSKYPIFIFSQFLGPGHLQGPGVRLGRFLGVLSNEPFLGEGGGPAGGLYRPAPPGNENPASQGARPVHDLPPLCCEARSMCCAPARPAPHNPRPSPPQVRVLVRLQHPNVMPCQALVVNENEMKAYLQLPYYTLSMCEWVATGPPLEEARMLTGQVCLWAWERG